MARPVPPRVGPTTQSPRTRRSRRATRSHASLCPNLKIETARQLGAVNLAAGLRDNPETDGQDMNIHPSELFCIQAEDDDGVYLTHRGRRIAKRHFGEPWAILEPGYQRVIPKLDSRIPANNARRSFARM